MDQLPAWAGLGDGRLFPVSGDQEFLFCGLWCIKPSARCFRKANSRISRELAFVLVENFLIQLSWF